MEPQEPKNEIKEELPKQDKSEDKNTNNNSQNVQKEEPSIQTFELGDERHPVDPEAEEIEYIGERIKALDHLEKCTKLKKLLLRRNVIKKIENISHLTQLKELELYDNQLSKI
jgi:Leucine-rich repeat (LRR) protein